MINEYGASDVSEPSEDMLLEQVISDGLEFVKSLTNYYGPEKGMEVFNSLGDAMGNTIKNKIFLAMLSGKTYLSVTFSAGAAETSNAVPVIKCIRTFTGYGLKEAKDNWDASKIRPQTIKVNSAQIGKEFRAELKRLGCIVY